MENSLLFDLNALEQNINNAIQPVIQEIQKRVKSKDHTYQELLKEIDLFLHDPNKYKAIEKKAYNYFTEFLETIDPYFVVETNDPQDQPNTISTTSLDAYHNDRKWIYNVSDYEIRNRLLNLFLYFDLRSIGAKGIAKIFHPKKAVLGFNFLKGKIVEEAKYKYAIPILFQDVRNLLFQRLQEIFNEFNYTLLSNFDPKNEITNIILTSEIGSLINDRLIINYCHQKSFFRNLFAYLLSELIAYKTENGDQNYKLYIIEKLSSALLSLLYRSDFYKLKIFPHKYELISSFDAANYDLSEFMFIFQKRSPNNLYLSTSLNAHNDQPKPKIINLNLLYLVFKCRVEPRLISYILLQKPSYDLYSFERFNFNYAFISYIKDPLKESSLTNPFIEIKNEHMDLLKVHFQEPYFKENYLAYERHFMVALFFKIIEDYDSSDYAGSMRDHQAHELEVQELNLLKEVLLNLTLIEQSKIFIEPTIALVLSEQSEQYNDLFFNKPHHLSIAQSLTNSMLMLRLNEGIFFVILAGNRLFYSLLKPEKLVQIFKDNNKLDKNLSTRNLNQNNIYSFLLMSNDLDLASFWNILNQEGLLERYSLNRIVGDHEFTFDNHNVKYSNKNKPKAKLSIDPLTLFDDLKLLHDHKEEEQSPTFAKLELFDYKDQISETKALAFSYEDHYVGSNLILDDQNLFFDDLATTKVVNSNSCFIRRITSKFSYKETSKSYKVSLDANGILSEIFEIDYIVIQRNLGEKLEHYYDLKFDIKNKKIRISFKCEEILNAFSIFLVSAINNFNDEMKFYTEISCIL